MKRGDPGYKIFQFRWLYVWFAAVLGYGLMIVLVKHCWVDRHVQCWDSQICLTTGIRWDFAFEQHTSVTLFLNSMSVTDCIICFDMSCEASSRVFVQFPDPDPGVWPLCQKLIHWFSPLYSWMDRPSTPMQFLLLQFPPLRLLFHKYNPKQHKKPNTSGRFFADTVVCVKALWISRCDAKCPSEHVCLVVVSMNCSHMHSIVEFC